MTVVPSESAMAWNSSSELDLLADDDDDDDEGEGKSGSGTLMETITGVTAIEGIEGMKPLEGIEESEAIDFTHRLNGTTGSKSIGDSGSITEGATAELDEITGGHVGD